MGSAQQLFGNTVGKKGFSQSGISIKEQIVKFGIEVADKGHAGIVNPGDVLSRCKFGFWIDYRIVIIIKGEGIEIFFFDDVCYVGLGI